MRIDTCHPDDLVDVLAFVESSVVITGREGLLPAADTCRGLLPDQVVDQGSEGRGVDATREAGADRHVAPETEADGVEEEGAQADNSFLVVGSCQGIGDPEVPVWSWLFGDSHPDDHRVGRRELEDPLKHRFRGVVEHAPCEVVHQARVIGPFSDRRVGEQGLDL